jgi:hypothetical protein
MLFNRPFICLTKNYLGRKQVFDTRHLDFITFSENNTFSNSFNVNIYSDFVLHLKKKLMRFEFQLILLKVMKNAEWWRGGFPWIRDAGDASFHFFVRGSVRNIPSHPSTFQPVLVIPSLIFTVKWRKRVEFLRSDHHVQLWIQEQILKRVCGTVKIGRLVKKLVIGFQHMEFLILLPLNGILVIFEVLYTVTLTCELKLFSFKTWITGIFIARKQQLSLSFNP